MENRGFPFVAERRARSHRFGLGCAAACAGSSSVGSDHGTLSPGRGPHTVASARSNGLRFGGSAFAGDGNRNVDVGLGAAEVAGGKIRPGASLLAAGAGAVAAGLVEGAGASSSATTGMIALT
jgi:hypothetical protein